MSIMSTRPVQPWAFQAVILLTILAVASWPTTIHAYVDPGNGSMIVQLLLGGIAGLAVALRVYWRRLVQVVRPKPKSGDGAAEA